MRPPSLFPTTVVGSLPRPQWVMDLFAQEIAGQVDPETFQSRLDSAVLYAIQLQEMAGVDIISDGEFRRESYVKIFAQQVGGFERDLLTARRFWTTAGSTTAGPAGWWLPPRPSRLSAIRRWSGPSRPAGRWSWKRPGF